MNRFNFILKLIYKGQYTLYSTVLEKGTFFLLFVLLARGLNPQEYGLIIIIFTFANILSAIFEFGLSSYFQREAAAKAINLQTKLQTALVVKGTCYLFYLLIVVAYYSTNSAIDILSAVIIATGIYLLLLNTIFIKILYGLDLFAKSFYALSLSRIAIVVFSVLTVITKLPISALYVILLFGAILQFIVLRIYLKDVGLFITLKLRIPFLSEILRSSLPIGIGLSFVWIYDKVDVLLIQRFMGAASVSYYSVAYSIYKAPQMVAGILLVPLFTELSKEYSRNNYLNKKELLGPAVLLLITSVSITLFVVGFSEIIINTIYGAKYYDSSGILKLLALGIPGYFMNYFTGVTLNAIRKEKEAMTSAFLALILNISFNIILLPRIGLLAAIVASIVTEYFIFLVQAFILMRK